MIKRLLVAAVAVLALGSLSAMADEKPTDAEAAKIKDAVTAWGCTGGKYEKESEASGIYEVDDAKCKDGQYDFKLDKDFKIISVTRD